MIENKNLPTSSIYKNYIDTVSFFDSYTIKLKEDIDIKELYLKAIVDSPSWVKILMSLRNKIVKLFGLATVENVDKKQEFILGEKIGIFTLYFINEHEIVAGEKDKHLDFCVSFLKDQDNLTVSTIVQYNNFFGKLYFTVIKPFHQIILKNMMKKLSITYSNKL